MALRARKVSGAFEKRAPAPRLFGLIAHLVKHCTGITEVMDLGLNSFQALISKRHNKLCL